MVVDLPELTFPVTKINPVFIFFIFLTTSESPIDSKLISPFGITLSESTGTPFESDAFILYLVF